MNKTFLKIFLLLFIFLLILFVCDRKSENEVKENIKINGIQIEKCIEKVNYNAKDEKREYISIFFLVLPCFLYFFPVERKNNYKIQKIYVKKKFRPQSARLYISSNSDESNAIMVL